MELFDEPAMMIGSCAPEKWSQEQKTTSIIIEISEIEESRSSYCAMVTNALQSNLN